MNSTGVGRWFGLGGAITMTPRKYKKFNLYITFTSLQDLLSQLSLTKIWEGVATSFTPLLPTPIYE